MVEGLDLEDLILSWLDFQSQGHLEAFFKVAFNRRKFRNRLFGVLEFLRSLLLFGVVLLWYLTQCCTENSQILCRFLASFLLSFVRFRMQFGKVLAAYP